VHNVVYVLLDVRTAEGSARRRLIFGGWRVGDGQSHFGFEAKITGVIFVFYNLVGFVPLVLIPSNVDFVLVHCVTSGEFSAGCVFVIFCAEWD
jgi:hypothetical protein